MPSSDQPLSYVICDKCGVLAHVFCLGYVYASTFEGALTDLIDLLGWQCFDCKTSNRNRLLDLEKECRSLKTEINKLKTVNQSLQKDMAALKFSLSTVSQQKPLERHQPVEVNDIPVAAGLNNNRIDSSNASYAQDAALPPSPASMDAILKSVHLEIMNKNKKKANIVISGLAPSKECDDKAMVSRLLSNHWSIPDDSIAGCKRLGQVQVNRIQPILVTLRNESIAEHILSSAKILRNSTCDEVRERIFINPDITKAESLALFELRERRRNKSKHHNEQQDQSHVQPPLLLQRPPQVVQPPQQLQQQAHILPTFLICVAPAVGGPCIAPSLVSMTAEVSDSDTVQASATEASASSDPQKA